MRGKRVYKVQGLNGKYRDGRLLWLNESGVQRYKKWGYDVRHAAENRSYQASLQTGRHKIYSSSREAWGKVCTELPHNRARLRDKTTNPVISYDDILDAQLALKAGI